MGPTKPIPQYDDVVGHWTVEKNERQRGKLTECDLKIFCFYQKCKVDLCITKMRNRFSIFHNAHTVSI